jgi:hypothetical protein
LFFTAATTAIPARFFFGTVALASAPLAFYIGSLENFTVRAAPTLFGFTSTMLPRFLL